MVRDLLVVGSSWPSWPSSSSAGYTTYRIWAQGQRDEQRPADAIVVMGAAQYDGRPSPVFAARLDHAVDLYLAGVAPRLVVTGGKAEGDRTTEAATARAYAIAHGVPARRRSWSRTAAGRRSSRSGRSASSCATTDLATPSSCRIGRTCCGCCGWPATTASTAWGSPTTTSPIETTRPAGSTPPLHELGALAQYFLAGGRSPFRLVRRCAVNGFPSWR